MLKEEVELKIQEAEFAAEETLRDFPAWKRWALICLTLAIIPGYIVAKNISYRNWQKRLKPFIAETRADVGEAKPLKHGNVMLVSNYNGTMAAYVEFTNENLDLSAKEVPIEIQFYGKGNKLIYTYNETTFFVRNTSKFIIVPRINSTEITSTAIIMPPTIKWQRKTSLPKVTISKTIAALSNPSDQPMLNAEMQIRNLSSYVIKKLRMKFFLYNKQGEVVGVAQRDEFDVEPKKPRTYKVFWPNISAKLVSKVEGIPDIDLLDPSNLQPITASTDSSSDLSRPDSIK